MILGITGSIGSGKHTAAAFLATRGWRVLDADKIAHHLYRPYTHVWKAVVKAFGEGILGQHDVINREKLGQMVFTRPAKLKKLNAILHPALIHAFQEQLHRHHRRALNIAIVAALWKELKLQELCDKILLIKINPPIAKERLMLRSGMAPEEFLRRLKTQKNPKAPDFTIENNGTRQEFYKALTNL